MLNLEDTIKENTSAPLYTKVVYNRVVVSDSWFPTIASNKKCPSGNSDQHTCHLRFCGEIALWNTWPNAFRYLDFFDSKLIN